MSIDYEHGGLQEGSIYIPLRHRGRPVFTTTEEAIAYAGDALAEIGPWPESVEIVEAAALEGRLEEIRYHERDPAAAKMGAIGAAMRHLLNRAEMMPRMPQLALVADGLAQLLWDSTRVYRVLPEEVP